MNTTPHCPTCRDATDVQRTSQGTGPVRWYECDFCGRKFSRRVDTKRVQRHEDVDRKRRARNAAEVRRFNERLGSKPRTCLGRAVTATPELRQLWNDVRRAKRADAVIRRGQKFYDALWEEAFDRGREGWTVRKILRADGSIDERLNRTTQRASAEISQFDAKDSSLFGHWQSGGFERQTIKLNVAAHADVTDLRRTLLHEILHSLDSLAKLDDDGHGRLWKQRLLKLEQIFPPRQFGVGA